MSWKKVEKQVTAGPMGMLKWIMIFVVVLALFFGALNALGLIGRTVVEREVFRNSFQYQAGMEQRGAILEANIIEIQSMIQQHPERRQELEGQLRVLRAQLNAITINQ